MENKAADNKRQQAKKEYQTKEEDGKTLYLDEIKNEWVSKKYGAF